MTETGPRRPMDPVDLLLHKQESDPRRRSIITTVLFLAGPPEWAALVGAIAAAVTSAPTLRQRLVAPLPGAGPPEWVTDARFAIDRHLDRRALPPPGDRSALMDALAELATEPLPGDRPPWQAVLFDGTDDAVAVLVLRFSHVLADGLAGLQLLAGLIEVDVDRRGKMSPRSEQLRRDYMAASAASDITGRRLTLERWLTLPVDLQARALRGSLGLVRITAATVNDPRGSADRAMRYARSLMRVLDPGSASGSPVLQDRSERRRYVLLEYSVRDLRAAGRAGGGSLNDAYLAAVLGGLRLYHEALGTPIGEIPFAIPVSTRSRAGADATGVSPGNRFAPVRFAAPIGESDPVVRMQKIAEIVRSARAEPALDAMTRLAPTLAQLPAAVIAALGRAQDRLDAQASYVPGPPVPVRLAGRPVRAMFGFGPLPGPAVMSVLLTYAGRAGVAFTLDAAAVSDTALFETAMRDGFDEVLALGRPSS